MFDGLAAWLLGLPPWFALMLALPFVIALIALIGQMRLAEDERKRHPDS